MTFTLLNADAIEAMQAMAENSVDSVVCDPPYGLEFMGKEWDRLGAGIEHVTEGMDSSHPFRDGTRRVRFGESAASMQEWHHAWATEALRILKPGGHLLAFGGTRTYHRLACAIEDAGFEIRDCIAWMYGSGFPKSLDVSKAIDKAAGAEREVVGTRRGGAAMKINGDNPRPWHERQAERGGEYDVTEANTPEAQRWNGWGTALKPAFEPIVLARKPLSERNVAANVQRWGTGALNIDGCRVDIDPTAEGSNFDRAGKTYSGDAPRYQGIYANGEVGGDPTSTFYKAGRWPANVTLDETAAAMLDEQTGERIHGAGAARTGAEVSRPAQRNGTVPIAPITDTGDMHRFGDTGGASRFFYCPKADREERNRGLEGYENRPRADVMSMNAHDHEGGIDGRGMPYKIEPVKNNHPTVKPVELMRWLCRMVTPKGGTVLDPFTGSGSTGVAAMREGFEFIGIEREADYVEIARARIIGDAPLFNVEAVTEPPEWDAPLADRIAAVAAERSAVDPPNE